MISKVGSVVLGLSVISLSLFAKQSDFTILFPLICLAFAAYFLILKKAEQQAFNFLIGAAILSRLFLVFTFPNLSDDIFRFAWDGHLILDGINPFSLLPSEVLELELDPFYRDLFPSLNSPNYYTIYPPVSQGCFTFAALLCPTSMYGFSVLLKSIFFIAELGTLYYLIQILKHYKLDKFKVMIYALNPLIIVEFCGNLHFEAIMVFFWVLSFYLLIKEKLIWAGIIFGLSVCAKLLTLIFLPFLIKRLGWKKSFIFFTIIGITCLALFSPILLGNGKETFLESLNLYFQKFEFNGSLYYIFREIGFIKKGYNLIAEYGPSLAKYSFFSIIALAIFDKQKTMLSFPKVCLFAISIYLLFTTTVHPWYLGLAIVCSVFSNFKYALLWSFLIMMTYVNYSFEPYYEPLWVVGLEYGLVIGFFVYELNLSPRPSPS